MSMAASTTSMSLNHLRRLGYLVDVVERWVPGKQVKQDLFGIIDLVAVRDGETLGVQVCARSGLSGHVKKMKASEAAPILQAAGWRLVVHGWSQPGGKGTVYRLEEFDLDPVTP